MMEYNDNQFLADLKRLVYRPVLIYTVFITAASLLIAALCIYGLLPSTALWSLVWIIPTAIGIFAAMHSYRKNAVLLAKKQQISVMAYHAKHAIDNLQQHFPDTYISDCRIKMRYLIKKGIDVDTALTRLDDNVEKYNELICAFLRESDKLEDELYDLMQPDTLIQYGIKAHMLRVKAEELGIRNLTDTAFFHEIEAYAGGLDIVRSNWKKLSFEVDEAYDIFSEYIKSIDLKDNAIDKDGNRITFKKWGEQLQEAFYALETYDTNKAKMIFSELNKYQIDADITSTLQGIISGIDEMSSPSKLRQF